MRGTLPPSPNTPYGMAFKHTCNRSLKLPLWLVKHHMICAREWRYIIPSCYRWNYVVCFSLRLLYPRVWRAGVYVTVRNANPCHRLAQTLTVRSHVINVKHIRKRFVLAWPLPNCRFQYKFSSAKVFTYSNARLQNNCACARHTAALAINTSDVGQAANALAVQSWVLEKWLLPYIEAPLRDTFCRKIQRICGLSVFGRYSFILFNDIRLRILHSFEKLAYGLTRYLTTLFFIA
jgi:hypothetical protein